MIHRRPWRWCEIPAAAVRRIHTPLAMPPKRRTAESEHSDNPNNALPAPPAIPGPATQLVPAKRQRVSRACDQCRAARERCDGKQPECHPCISQGRPCTYEVSPKKRGVQTGYIRTLELTLGWVFENIPGSEEALDALLSHEGGQGHPILAGKDPRAADRLQKRWRRSRIHRGIDCILSGGAVPSPGRDGPSPSADASDTEGDAARIDGSTGTGAQESQTHQLGYFRHRPSTPREDEPQGTGQHWDIPPIRTHHGHAASPGRLKLPQDHWRLLDIYFSYTHSWLPVLEKQDLFQASYLYPEDGLDIRRDGTSSAVHAELWAALALASLQDATSSKQAASDHAGSAGLSPSEIYDIARGLLPSEHGTFQIHHARAFLLLGLVHLAQEKLTSASLMTGSAIRILLAPSRARHATQEKEKHMMKLALMACFIIDTILSVRCGEPPHLRAEDLADLPSIPEGGLDQWEPWTPCDGFGAGNAGSRSSRSPSFCLSTFNQLYAIVKVVAREMSVTRRTSSPTEGLGRFGARLQQAMDPNLPFSGFITSSQCGNASVPTPLVTRATYLWASALADPLSDSVLPLLHETLDQYQRTFGKCSIPPFIPACIASLANEEHLLACGEQNRGRLRDLVSTYSSRRLEDWRPSNVRGSQADFPSPSTRDPLGMANPVTIPSISVMPYPTPAMPSLYNSPSAPQHPRQHRTGREYSSFSAQTATPAYNQSFQEPPIAVPQGSNMHMALGTPVGALPALPTAHHTSLHRAGFGPSPDYDALLDDLASIECTDAVDVDTQFMTNLGFAPGCDIAEILARDFGGV
ncbi:hypothetical protein VTI74DRAFT_493 [Chaetomium olivicolor]